MLHQYNVPGYIEYCNGLLHVNGIPYTAITSKHSSPTICTSLDRIRSNIAILNQSMKTLNAEVHYALKANYDRKVVETVLSTDVGVEVISGYEWFLAERAGFPAKKIVMNGLGRTGDELLRALNAGATVNIDSISELKKLTSHKQNVHTIHRAIGLRVNPQFEGEGNFVKRYGKLGMDYVEAYECISFAHEAGLQVQGFSFHIFSNQTDSTVYSEPLQSLAKFIQETQKQFSVDCKYIDIGGGIAPRMFFENDIALESFLAHVLSLLKSASNEDVRIVIEPGRYVVADACIIFSQIKTIKKNAGGTWAVLDIGTNYLIPAPGSNYKVIPCKMDNETNQGETVSFVDGICSPAGHICEAPLRVEEGQIVAVLNSGAYTSVMREEFVFGTPRSVYIENGAIVERTEKVSAEYFATYHGWK